MKELKFICNQQKHIIIIPNTNLSLRVSNIFPNIVIIFCPYDGDMGYYDLDLAIPS